MKPLFKKIRKHLADDGRPLKYFKYAIGEIVLVVIGILIALSINNWNNKRKDGIKEKYFLNSILTSIQLSQNELNRVIDDSKHISSCADTLFLILADRKFELLGHPFLDSLLFNAGDYSIISLNDGGIQEILNTGSLDLIQDQRIRVLLASWNERIHKIRKFEGESEYVARDYNEYLMDFCDFSRFVRDTLNSVIIPEKRVQLLTDPYLTNYLGDIASTHYGMHTRYSEEKKLMDSLTALIHESLLE